MPSILLSFMIDVPMITMMTTMMMIMMMMSSTQMELINAGTAPQINPVKAVLKALPGKIAVMPCVATGEPAPSITWERDGTPIQMFGSRFSVNKESMALRVFRMMTEDSGNYTCIAKNRFGMDSVTIMLLVLVKPKAMITSPTNFTFMEMTNQELVCRSRGLPRPTFEWQTNHHERIRTSPSVYIDNTPIYDRIYTRERQVDNEVSESVLVFEPITYEDFGSFTCVASNDVGTTRTSVDLDVRFSPKVLSKHNSPQHVTWWEGLKSNLTCIVAGNELPEITWSLNGRPFDCRTSEDVVHGSEISSTCMVMSSRHGGPGNYTCHANNSLGSLLVHEFHVQEVFPPPPVNFRPISVKRYEIVLSVKVPVKDDTPPSSYVLATYKLASYKVDDNVGSVYEAMADVNDEGEATMKLPGVLQDRDYVVTMQAKNLVGFGPESTMVISTEIPSPTPGLTPLPTPPTHDDAQIGDDDDDINLSNTDDIDDDDHSVNDYDNTDDENNNNNAEEGNVVSRQGVDNSRDDDVDRGVEAATAYKVLGNDNGATALHLAAFFGSLSFRSMVTCCLYLIALLCLNS